ncbi:MAG: hypothetical protein H7062_09490, partial [Candidatus Saccharimonas sp.]|nr:hypothetical protein [Planctomycetaceae bacterium]
MEFAHSRQPRLLTAHFQPGDAMIFGGFTMHGSLDNHSPLSRVRLSVDVRYQPAANPADDPRSFDPHPSGAKGGSYGEQKDAQPLGSLGRAAIDYLLLTAHHPLTAKGTLATIDHLIGIDPHSTLSD